MELIRQAIKSAKKLFFMLIINLKTLNMKKYILVLYLILSGRTLFTQTNLVTISPLIDTTFTTNLTGDFFIESKQIVGSQYFNNDWENGDIVLSSGDTIKSKLLKYNGLYDELIWLNTTNYGIFKLDKSNIDKFWLNNKNFNSTYFKKIWVSNEINDSLYLLFTEVAVEGKYSLYIHRKISKKLPQFKVVNNVRRQLDVLESKPEYYIQFPSNEIRRIKKNGRRITLKQIPLPQQRLKKIIHENHLNIGIEKDLIKLFEFL